MTGSIRDDRPLTGQERTLLAWLIQNGNGNSEELMAQLAEARVVSRCGCGCPTIDLAIGTKSEPTRGGSSIVADVSGKSPEGYDVGVILHVREGLLSELEVYPSVDVGPFSLPVPDSLTQWSQASDHEP
jgi:hypothetical protein